MGNTKWAGARTWEPLEDPDIPAATVALGESVDDHWIGKFANTTARDAALAALPSAQRPGCFCHVTGRGFFSYTGSAWRRIEDTLTQAGIKGGTTEPTGLLITGFPVAFATGTVPVVTVSRITSALGSPPIILNVYTAAGYAPTSGAFHIWAQFPSGQAAGSTFMEFGWSATGIRANES